MVGYSSEKPIPEPSNQDKRLRKKEATLVLIGSPGQVHLMKLDHETRGDAMISNAPIRSPQRAEASEQEDTLQSSG